MNLDTNDINLISVISAVAQAVLALIALILSVVIPLMIHKGSKLIAKLQYEKSMRESWIAVDTVALSSEEMIRIADGLVSPDSTNESLETLRKRWFVLIMMNPIKDMYFGAMHGLYEPKEAVLQNVSQILSPILQDEDAFRITQSHGYEKEFSDFCRTVRDRGRSSRQGNEA